MPEAGFTAPDPYRRAVTDALAPVPRSADGTAVWRALGQAGALAGLYSATESDQRPDPARLAVLLSELDARYPAGPILSVGVPAASALPILAEAGAGGELARQVHRAAVAGELLVCLAATDAGAPGSDLLAATTRAQLSADAVVVDGGKRWITNARTARYALVLARHRPARHLASFVWVLVPADAAGVDATPAGEDLFAGSGLGHLRFDGVRLGRDHLVGAPGRAVAALARHLGTERFAGGVWARERCRRVLAATHRRLAGRTLHDRPAWDNDAVRQRFARCLVELARLDAMCRHYLASRDGPQAALAGMLLKAAAGESLSFVLAECVHLHGADAFADGGLARELAEAAMWGVAGGATGAMLAGIADHAADLVGPAAPAPGELVHTGPEAA